MGSCKRRPHTNSRQVSYSSNSNSKQATFAFTLILISTLIVHFFIVFSNQNDIHCRRTFPIILCGEYGIVDLTNKICTSELSSTSFIFNSTMACYIYSNSLLIPPPLYSYTRHVMLDFMNVRFQQSLKLVQEFIFMLLVSCCFSSQLVEYYKHGESKLDKVFRCVSMSLNIYVNVD